MAENDYPVELRAPDLSAYRLGNTGVPYATTLDSGRAGPHLLIMALVHGNELCGAIALDFLLKANLQPVRGKVTLAFANIAAYAQFDPQRPTASRFVDEDLNRLWSADLLDGKRHSVELERARALRPLVDQADVLLDIHSMQDRCAPLMLCGAQDKGRRLARELGFPAHIVADTGHDAGQRLRDYGGFAEGGSTKNALLIECGQHWERVSADVAIESAVRLLHHLQMVRPDFAADRLSPDRGQMLIEVTDAVTVNSERFRFTRTFRSLDVIPRAGTLIAVDAGREIRTRYDNCVLIMPSRRLARGQTAVRLGHYHTPLAMADAAD